MSEKRILLASLLKPVNDTRMYEKLGLSLGKLPQTQVHIVGYHAPAPAGVLAHLELHPLFRFKRLGTGRLAAQRAYYQLLQQLQPDMVIVCTHELLLASYLYCRSNSCKLLYDVQENYALNLKSQDNYPPLLKQLLARGVRGLEERLARRIDHFLVAEKSYLQELPFLTARATLLENKYKPEAGYAPPPTPKRLPQQPLRLLYSGTIARLYGVFEAVALADRLHQLEPQTTLTLIGYCADSATWRQLQQEVANKPYIHLIGGERLVPHQRILEAIKACNIGLLPYRPHASTFRCMPTKLYEYAAYALPMVVQHNPLWQDFLRQHQAGLSIDFASPDAVELLRQLRAMEFYQPGVPAGVFWESEEQKLLQTVQAILKKTDQST